jgi:hypothetical protein
MISDHGILTSAMRANKDEADREVFDVRDKDWR